MPYIKQEERTPLDAEIVDLVDALFDAPPHVRSGALNYVVTRLVTKACCPNSNWSYEQLMTAIGTLECAKLELYRRVGGPKEDRAVGDNGDTPEYRAFMRNNFPGDYV